MSLRIAPSTSQATSISHVSGPAAKNATNTATPSLTTPGAPSAPTAVHDTMRNGLISNSTALNSRHPLEARLKNWDETQETLKMETLKRVYGIAEPIRRGMEMRIVGSDFRPAALGGPSNLHLDILRNRDTMITWEDVFQDEHIGEPLPNFHDEMERKLRMNW